MVRLSAIFVSFCMVLIAISIGAVVFLGFGLSGPECIIIAIAALTALALYDAVAKQMRSRSIVAEQIANLSRGTADLAWQVGDLTRQVAECSRRMAVLERKVEQPPPSDRNRAVLTSHDSEIGELGAIVKQLAEAVAAHETALAERPLAAELAPFPQDMEPVNLTATAAPVEHAALEEVDTEAQVETDTEADIYRSTDAVNNDAILTMIRGIIDANRVDLYLQPIVTLPQRKIRYYEALTRLRSENGSLLLPVDFIEAAESGGLMPRIDLLILTRAAQVVRRLLQKNRDIGLICNVSAYTLVDHSACQQMRHFMEANQELASSLLLEFPQSVWRAMGAKEQDSIAALVELGVRFSIDRVSDLRIEPQDLANRGIRLVKVPARLLLETNEKPELDIHPADLANLLARYGIGLIAEKIESESMVVDLFDYDVRFGQGFLFSAPRPVRADVLQGTTAAEGGKERETAAKVREPGSARRAIANAVEDLRNTAILGKPATGGSSA
ncbi:MAG TPA: EAL domain-containing protein [Xanthobacteraceae bacterium]|nr:EAL domain-containing protein [Xanthobacteraceae bacterium]